MAAETKRGYIHVEDTPTSFYVATTGDDGNDCLSPATACQTIQAAIDKASSGDTVSVAAGIYNENVVVKDGVDLLGAGADATTIDASGTGHVICANNVNATISGFSITGSGGETSVWCGPYGSYGTGVFSTNGSNLVLERNRIFGNLEGVRNWPATLTMRNNFVYDNSTVGVVGQGASVIAVVNNTLAEGSAERTRAGTPGEQFCTGNQFNRSDLFLTIS